MAQSIRFPMACPACSAVSAMPTATTPDEGATHVGMHCRHCGHDWLFEIDTDAEVTDMRSGVRLPIARPPRDKS